jgi:hypothetical protein
MGTFLGRQFEDVLTIEAGRPFGHFVGRVTGKHIGQRALAGSVRTHDGVNFTRVDREVNPLEDFLVLDRRVKILDFKHWSFAGIRHGFRVNPPDCFNPHPVRRQGVPWSCSLR